jgi:hypothetical protein
MPRSPAIFAHAKELDEAESRLDIGALVCMGLAGATSVDYKFERGEVTTREDSSRRLEHQLARKQALEQPAAANDAASQ